MPELIEKKRSQIKYFLLFAGFIICVVCVYYVYTSFKWQEIWIVLKQANPILFFFGSTLSLMLYWLTRCLRWRVLLREENKIVPFRILYLYTAVTLSFSTITPFRTGEALKVELLKKHNAARTSGYTNFAIERLLDLMTVVGFALFGLSGELYDRIVVHIYLVGSLLVLFCLLSLLTVFLFPANIFDKLRRIIKERVKFNVLGKIIVLTLTSWGLVACGWHLSLQSLGIYLSFHQIMLLLSVTTLAGILSFVPGSVGVSEISISQILLQMGYQTSLAQSGAFIIRGYALMIILLGLIHLFALRFVVKNERVFDNSN